MKLCKEMIEAMGGADSGLYVRFRMLACEAYNILRKSADLILSLFHLMAGASIEAIRSNPENAMLKLQVRRNSARIQICAVLCEILHVEARHRRCFAV
jgi:phosphatidylinositol kinase/protein kinase (PI-3  family)